MTDRFAALRPAPECPKCGDDVGFAHVLPRYEEGTLATNQGLLARSWLKWACLTCGYSIKTDTLNDTQVPA